MSGSSGASEAARRLEELGVPVIRADAVGHEILQLPDIVRQLREALGDAILTPSGEVDRAILGQRVFSDAEARRALNRIVHPPLLDRLTDLARRTEAATGAVLVDAALIYEWGVAGFFHHIIVVEAPLELRIARAMQRDRLTREQALERIAAQMPLEEKVARADAVIRNAGTVAELEQEIERIWRALAQV